MTESLEQIADAWAKLGAGYLGESEIPTPDLEHLVLRTAVRGRDDPRTVTLAVTWLSRYASLVAEHRLCKLVRDGAIDRGETCGLGFMLDTALRHARRHDRRRNLSRARDLCAPADVPGPWFTIDEVNEAMRERARRRSSPLALRWNLWVEPLELKWDALRPRAWLRDRNPSLAVRATFRGDLRATIVLALEDDPRAGESVSRLSTVCGVTRLAVENALRDLELASAVVCERRGRSCATRLAA